MTGREFVQELERRGYAVKRRCRSFVWMGRGDQTLMLDEDATVPDKFLKQLLTSIAPPSLRSKQPPSLRSRSSVRPSVRPSARPSKRP